MHTERPSALYVVIGRPDPAGSDVGYPTDPRVYGLHPLDVPEEEYDGKYLHCVHAYKNVEDAVDAIYRCGLEPAGSFLKTYLWINDEWVFSEQETDRVMDEIDW